MASTMFAAEMTSSTFLGTSMPTGTVAPSTARVSMMAYSRQELERKPLSLLRTLARQNGVKGVSRFEIINNLAGSSFSYSAPSSASTTDYSAPTSGSVSELSLKSMTLGELRALAKKYNLRGDTKAELIKLILESPAKTLGTEMATPSYTSGGPITPAPSGLPKAQLERKTLSELRAMARARGLRGDTKAELVKLLSSDGSAPDAAPAASPSYSNGASSSNGASYGSSNASIVRQLSVKSLSQLRAMASVKGIRGTTKDELVKQLAMVV